MSGVQLIVRYSMLFSIFVCDLNIIGKNESHDFDSCPWRPNRTTVSCHHNCNRPAIYSYNTTLVNFDG